MPDEARPPLMSSSPMWEPPDPDLTDAAGEDPDVAVWMETINSIGDVTMQDNLDQQLYSQASDALRQQGIEPTEQAIEDWVDAHRTNSP